MIHRSYAFIFLIGSAVALLAGCGGVTFNQPISSGRSPASGLAGKTHAGAPPAAPGPSSATPVPKCELPVPDHFSIDVWVERFSEEKHRSFQTQLERARFHAVPAQEVFELGGLPKDLIYVALIESGFTPKARSHAKAVGMWQFISSTGKRFGLEQNEWVDERCNPMKSARAAADYLSFLYDTFGSWPLALAAYNAGENRVQEALDQSGLPTFWDLADNGWLPAETRDYVPKVFAAVKIIRDPRRYGFHFDPGHYVAPGHETVCIPGGVKLSWVGKKLGVSEDVIENCNPELCKSITPPSCSSYELCVPKGKGGDLLMALAERSHQEQKAQNKAAAVARPEPVATYKARPGDTWLGLAKKHKCSAKALASLNAVTTSHPLKAGQTLKVPGGGVLGGSAPGGKSMTTLTSIQTRDNKDKPSTRKSGGRQPASPEKKAPKPFYYPVRRGDTLSSIAERFRTSVKALCAQNELSVNHKLIPGYLLEVRTCRQD